jgi:hypothetical protein
MTKAHDPKDGWSTITNDPTWPGESAGLCPKIPVVQTNFTDNDLKRIESALLWWSAGVCVKEHNRAEELLEVVRELLAPPKQKPAVHDCCPLTPDEWSMK